MYNLTLKIVAGNKLEIRTETRTEALDYAKGWLVSELGRNPTAEDIAFVKGYDEARAGFLSMIAPAMLPSVKSGMMDWAKKAAA